MLGSPRSFTPQQTQAVHSLEPVGLGDKVLGCPCLCAPSTWQRDKGSDERQCLFVAVVFQGLGFLSVFCAAAGLCRRQAAPLVGHRGKKVISLLSCV